VKLGTVRFEKSYFEAKRRLLRQAGVLRQSRYRGLCLKKPIIAGFMRQKAFLPQKAKMRRAFSMITE
jgi:hypothetical protein